MPQEATLATVRRDSERRDRVPQVPPAGVRYVTERQWDGAGPRLYTQPDWAAALPWVVQGITARPADMSLFGQSPAGSVLTGWLHLRNELGCRSVIHSRQVHAADVLVHQGIPAGVLVAGDADGHATREPAALLAVSVADCVPISIAAPDARAVALLHGGWRGVAAGILERGIEVLRRRLGARAAALHVHCGPAICGDCFEVGAEVPTALGLVDRTAAMVSHVDLRAALAQRAVTAGVDPSRISISTHCTRCGDSPFHSHRAGCRERQISVLGIRPDFP
ncbi:peptidoglycan editing factor PgeF [soil metagenome]